MESKLATSGFITFFEKIARSHPLIYIFLRSIIRFTNIFEKDFNGVKLLNFENKVNLIDVGASDGIATKFLKNNLKCNKILCFEPDQNYVKILRKLKIKNLTIKPFGIGLKDSKIDIFIPRYKIFNKNFDIISYTGYDEKFMNHMLLDFRFKNNLSIIKKKIFIKKINRINHKIDLIKIDTNGHELSIIKGLIKFIKRDKPALLVEENYDSNKIMKLLKSHSYKGYYYSIKKKKFELKKDKDALNRYYLQKKHLKI
ncbi:FkbM family methyltransferase [Candidatus Pelagibacter sp.]|nr:FkbM family methyltransferase [Candidatus Pelagibacter sp.]